MTNVVIVYLGKALHVTVFSGREVLRKRPGSMVFSEGISVSPTQPTELSLCLPFSSDRNVRWRNSYKIPEESLQCEERLRGKGRKRKEMDNLENRIKSNNTNKCTKTDLLSTSSNIKKTTCQSR